MGGVGTQQAAVSQPGIGGIVQAVRVASKPAFAIVVAAAAFLAQDIFQRVTHVQVTVDEGAAFVTLFSWLAYWATPASVQDAPVVTGPQTPAA